MKQIIVLVLAFAVTSVAGGIAFAADQALQPGDYVGVIGDSITEQRAYTVFIEDYLLMCKPAANVQLSQFGWGGVQSRPGGIQKNVLRFGPSVVTVCLGMNEGGYGPMDGEKGKRFLDQQRVIAKTLTEGKVRLVILGTPGCVDSDTFRKNNIFKVNPLKGGVEASVVYNETLRQLGEVSRQAAGAAGVAFADLHTPMMAVMAKAKAKYGPTYHLAGGDGVHPDRNGHLVMAYAFLKAMACSGDIGTIAVDVAANSATATDGHKVLGCKDGAVEIESTRYPFCFFGDPKDTGSTSGVIEFFPFNDDLNRLTLVVKGAQGEKVRVTWIATPDAATGAAPAGAAPAGGAAAQAVFTQASREFSAADLAKGINLAATFIDNPFCEPFRRVESKIARQQETELWLVKTLLSTLPEYERAIPDEKDALARIADAIVKRSKALRDESAAAVVPVRHTIRIGALEGK